jgi:hypothetical protein
LAKDVEKHFLLWPCLESKVNAPAVFAFDYRTIAFDRSPASITKTWFVFQVDDKDLRQPDLDFVRWQRRRNRRWLRLKEKWKKSQ